MSGDVVSLPLPMVEPAEHVALERAHRAGEHEPPPCRYVAGRAARCSGDTGHVATFADGERIGLCDGHAERARKFLHAATIEAWTGDINCRACAVQYGGRRVP